MTVNDWLIMAKLLKRYDSLIYVLQVMSNMNPKNEALSSFKEKLDKGEKFEDILGSNNFEKLVKVYLKHLPLQKAIMMANSRLEHSKEIVQTIVKKTSYHFLIFVLGTIILQLFTSEVLPSMQEILSSSGKITTLLVFFKILRIIQDLFLAILLLVILTSYCVVISHKANYLWVFLHKLNHDKYFKMIVTIYFAEDLKLLLENGVALDEAIITIKDCNNSCEALLAYHFNDDLSSGKDIYEGISNEFLDNDFKTITTTGLVVDDFIETIKDYLLVSNEKLKRLINKIVLAIQLITYGFVINVILLAYEVLLLPLEILEEI